MTTIEQMFRDDLAAGRIYGGMAENIASLLAEIERLRQWETAAREWLDKTDWVQQQIALPPKYLGKHRADVIRLEIERLTAERDALVATVDRLQQQWAENAPAVRYRAERDALRDTLLSHGFVPCDIPACNCESWHPRFGLPERMQEIKDDLDEAGHPLSNENGNLARNALRELIVERDALRKENVRLQIKVLAPGCP